MPLGRDWEVIQRHFERETSTHRNMIAKRSTSLGRIQYYYSYVYARTSTQLIRHTSNQFEPNFLRDRQVIDTAHDHTS